MRRPLVPALALVLALGACSSEAPTTGSPEQPAATGAGTLQDGGSQASAPEPGSDLDVEEFAAAMERPEAVVLDVRTPAEFESGHLPGALNVDATAPDFDDRLAELDQDVPYAVYCASGNRSGVAMQQMLTSGFDDVVHLAGGIGAWRQADRPVTGE